MWCLIIIMIIIIIIIVFDPQTEGVGTSHLKLIWVRGFILSFSNITSWNTTSLNTQVAPLAEKRPRKVVTRDARRCYVQLRLRIRTYPALQCFADRIRSNVSWYLRVVYGSSSLRYYARLSYVSAGCARFPVPRIHCFAPGGCCRFININVYCY